MITPDQQMAAFEAGYIAYIAYSATVGLPKPENIYPLEDKESYTAWEEGFFAAHEDEFNEFGCTL